MQRATAQQRGEGFRQSMDAAFNTVSSKIFASNKVPYLSLEVPGGRLRGGASLEELRHAAAPRPASPGHSVDFLQAAMAHHWGLLPQRPHLPGFFPFPSHSTSAQLLYFIALLHWLWSQGPTSGQRLLFSRRCLAVAAAAGLWLAIRVRLFSAKMVFP